MKIPLVHNPSSNRAFLNIHSITKHLPVVQNMPHVRKGDAMHCGGVHQEEDFPWKIEYALVMTVTEPMKMAHRNIVDLLSKDADFA